MDTNWYVVKVIPGKERSLTESFNKMVKENKLPNIRRFVCPLEREAIKSKTKQMYRDKVIYVGYLYFEANENINDDDLKFISSHQNIMGMMGDKTPKKLNKLDINRILKDELLDEHIQKKNTKFSIGDRVLINNGPFDGFEGIISTIIDDKVTLEVKIFGRITNVELTINDIAKW